MDNQADNEARSFTEGPFSPPPFETQEGQMDCPICTERDDLRRTAPKGDHGLLAHSQFGQLAWELGINRLDNPDEWRELKSVTR